MTYSVKECFLTLQGEGFHAGRAAVFLRFAGCNLWSGRAQDRGMGKGGCAAWCDTDFVGMDAQGGGRFITATELAAHVEAMWGSGLEGRMVVCTGGEPMLQLDDELVDQLHRRHFFVAVETNGTLPIPSAVDWVCISPKAGAALANVSGDECKFVFPQAGLEPDAIQGTFDHWFIQPMDGPKIEENTKMATEYCIRNPNWRLSVQMHKLVGIK